MDLTKIISFHPNLTIIPSATSAYSDFDFLEGKWHVKNRKLKERLAGCTEWITFESEIHLRKTLMGNIENYYAIFEGVPFEGMAVRLFDPQTELWTIYWIDSSIPKMDTHPVVGSFENKVGEFFTKDVFNGEEILVVYKWDATNADQPIWSQAYSLDEGKSWEWNWEMVLSEIY